MEVLVLASGSSGNAVLVRGPEGAVLIDVGISHQALRRRMEAYSVSIDEVKAVVVTHEHQDHVRGLDVLRRRTTIPVWMTGGTSSALGRSDANVFEASECPTMGGFSVSTVRTSHDAAEPVAVVLTDGDRRIAVCTDTGVVSSLLAARLRELDILLVESNHDADLLRHGPYPWALKQRIASRHGHLANHQTAEAVAALCSPRLRGVVALHLSEENNSPELAEQCLTDAVGGEVPVVAVGRDEMLRVAFDGSDVAWAKTAPPPARRKRRSRG